MDPARARSAPRRRHADEPVAVEWEVATDERFERSRAARPRAARRRVGAHACTSRSRASSPAAGTGIASAPADEVSPVGRTRTAPAPGRPADRLRFAFASCQQYEQGYYTAYRHMSPTTSTSSCISATTSTSRPGAASTCASTTAPEPRTLDDYRSRYALYKSDADLQARTPPVPGSSRGTTTRSTTTTPTTGPRSSTPREWFLARRAAAYRAYYEHMPLRRAAWCRRPAHAHLPPRRLRPARPSSTCSTTASTARTRSARAPGRGGVNVVEDCADAARPAAHDARATPGAVARRRPRALARPLERDRPADADGAARPQAGRGQGFWTDGWDGYPAARRRLLRIPRAAEAGESARDRRRHTHVSGSPISSRTSTIRSRRSWQRSSSGRRSPPSSAASRRTSTRCCPKTRTSVRQSDPPRLCASSS